MIQRVQLFQRERIAEGISTVPLHFHSHFTGEPGLAGTRMSILEFIEAEDDGGGGDN